MATRTHHTLRELDDLSPDARNANSGTARGRKLLTESLQTYGAARSIVTDRSGRIIAGNKTFEQARTLNLPITVVRSDGGRLVVVQRTDLDLSDPKARALAIADNRIGELDLQWDPAVLEALRNEGLPVDNWWTEREWQDLLGADETGDPADEQVLEPGPTTIVRGDLFALGEHRLLCGDATDAGDVSRLLGDTTPLLMATDPPYGVRYDPRARHRAFPGQRHAVGAVLNDDQAAWPEAFRLFPGDVVYAWHAARFAHVVAASLEAEGFDLRAQIIWAKSHFALSRGNYHYQHEPAWYAVRRGASAHWRGDRAQSTVWSVASLGGFGGQRSEDDARTAHSTQKPVRLYEIPLLNHTQRGDAVYDPFCGSGTALMAAEKLERRALVMDVDPRYVQITLDRWEARTGKKAARLSQGASA